MTDPWRTRFCEAPLGVLVLGLRVPDADPRTDCDLGNGTAAPHLEAALAKEWATTEFRIDPKRLRDLPWTGEHHWTLLAAASSLDELVPFHRLTGANEHRSALPLAVRHEIQHLMKTVAEVDVRMPGRAPHRRVASGNAGTAVICAVIRESIGLDLGDTQADRTVPDLLSKKVTCNFQRVARVKLSGKQSARHGRKCDANRSRAPR